jgi:hypothetical protein
LDVSTPGYTNPPLVALLYTYPVIEGPVLKSRMSMLFENIWVSLGLSVLQMLETVGILLKIVLYGATFRILYK